MSVLPERPSPASSAAGNDAAVAARPLGRPPAGRFAVAVTEGDGQPAVIENEPLLDDGTPMPTLFWLVDPELTAAVSRLEAAVGCDGRRKPSQSRWWRWRTTVTRRFGTQSLAQGHEGPVPSGGVGGYPTRGKCLHAHVAWYLAGGDDPVGRWTWGAARGGAKRNSTATTMDDESVRVAAVDCGTNSTRLIVAGPAGDVLEREMRITRLGQEVDATHRLSDRAIVRTVAVLEDYRRLMDEHGVSRVRVVATSAARDAENAEDFMAAAERRHGCASRGAHRQRGGPALLSRGDRAPATGGVGVGAASGDRHRRGID